MDVHPSRAISAVAELFVGFLEGFTYEDRTQNDDKVHDDIYDEGHPIHAFPYEIV